MAASPLPGPPPFADHPNHASNLGSCLDNPRHNADDFCYRFTNATVNANLGATANPPIRSSDTDMAVETISNDHYNCCRCGQDVFNSQPYECNTCGCTYHPACVTDQEKFYYDISKRSPNA